MSRTYTPIKQFLCTSGPEAVEILDIDSIRVISGGLRFSPGLQISTGID